MIYSPACLLADQSRVWVGRFVDPVARETMRRHFERPSAGASAVVVAGHYASAYAYDLEKTT